ncbi:MAG TPA: DUF6152 family protein [Bryobacteraceae bacterium]|nr:DUF6152 family protein [Bryobacteraceae bacterium]
MRGTIAAVTMAAGLLLAAAPIWAHHSFAAEFDEKKVVKLHGTVTRMEWVNPHAWIHIAVKNPDGTTTEWMIEGNTPNGLLRRGFTKKSLEPGTEVFVEGYQAKSGDNKANGSSITFKDGKRLFLGSSHDEQEGQKQ